MIVGVAALGLLAWQRGTIAAEKKAPAKKAVAPAKKAAAAPAPVKKTIDRLAASLTKDDVTLYSSGYIYTVQAEGVNSAGYIMYFAAKDFTSGKDLIVKRVEKNEMKVDTADRKTARTVFSLGEQNRIESDYGLEVVSEVRKGLPMLALYSRFIYRGQGCHNCGVNWGISASSEKAGFKYYTLPKEGKMQTFKLAGDDSNKIGYARWIYVHNGRGSGTGVICPAMLGKGPDFLFVNSVPPQKDLETNQAIDVFLLSMPITKDFKVLEKLYGDVAKITWDMESFL